MNIEKHQVCAAHARQLISEARGNFIFCDTANAIAILAIEEAGKACLLRWDQLGLLETRPQKLSHLDKQKVLAAALLGIKASYDCWIKADAPKHIKRELLEELERLLLFVHAKWAFNIAVAIDLGVLSRYKELAFYSDVTNVPHAGPKDVERRIHQAEGLLELLDVGIAISEIFAKAYSMLVAKPLVRVTSKQCNEIFARAHANSISERPSLI